MVCEVGGGVLYDLIDMPIAAARKEASVIARICNSGIGPDWDSVSAEMERRKRRQRKQVPDAR